MIVFICGPQGSGKTTIANRCKQFAKNTDRLIPEIYDEASGFEFPTEQLVTDLYAYEIMGLTTIIISQQEPPKWMLKRFNYKTIKTEPFMNLSKGRPEIICLCGSTRFMEAFQQANLQLTLDGKIVLSVGCNTKSDADLFDRLDAADKIKKKMELDELHKRKIDIADEILVLNVGGYIGESTASEIAYAELKGKKINYWETN